MAKTSVLITPCGGTGTVLTFLQPGSTAIVFNYWQDLKNISVQMESIYYWYDPCLTAPATVSSAMSFACMLDMHALCVDPASVYSNLHITVRVMSGQPIGCCYAGTSST